MEKENQQVFFDTVLPVIDTAGVCWLCAHYTVLSKYVKRWLCCLLILGLCSNLAVYSYRFRDGIKSVLNIQAVNNTEEENSQGYSVTKQEKESMTWLKENTPKDAVIAVNRHYYNSQRIQSLQPLLNDRDPGYYFCSVFGERKMFIGSWMHMIGDQRTQNKLRERLVVNDALFNPQCANRREIMEANGISYLVAFAEAGTGMDLPDKDLDCVFRNQDAAIYALKTGGR